MLQYHLVILKEEEINITIDDFIGDMVAFQGSNLKHKVLSYKGV